MSTTTNLLTWEAFEQLPDDFSHKEILEGELLILPPPKSGHSAIAHRLYDFLTPILKQNRLGRAYIEAGFLLSRNPPTWVQPDVSYLSRARVLETTPDGYFSGAPELAVEIISPSESTKDIERKNKLMFTAGTLIIWVIYPKLRHVWVHSPGASKLFTEGETLSAPDILPGFEMPVTALFVE